MVEPLNPMEFVGTTCTVELQRCSRREVVARFASGWDVWSLVCVDGGDGCGCATEWGWWWLI
ncbi:hypothetical protein SESBI_46931 [Sesbania bispinosa]|nr:hypothetical protein SESBI_46931 [Sesbania bispinosa]